MVATAKRKAERAKAFAEAQAKSHSQAQKNASKPNTKKPSPPSNPTPPTTAEPSNHDLQSKTEANPTNPEPAKNHRFILFIGNLPFTATTPQIEQHFISVRPRSIRHSTDKTTGRSKGFAFLEFDDYSRMTACIKNFHHSLFGAANKLDSEDGEKGKKSKGEEGRRINVELTVGGGGSKSTARKMKLRAKNEKLSRERRKRGATSKSEKKDEEVPEREEIDHIHPSRRAKVSG